MKKIIVNIMCIMFMLVSHAQTSISYFGNFSETVSNDGAVVGSRVVTVNGNTFAVSLVEGAQFTLDHKPDGLTAVMTAGTQTIATSMIWTAQSAPTYIHWTSVTYGNGLFVAIADVNYQNSLGSHVMTSSDGITWTIQTTPAVNNHWLDIIYENGLFVALSGSGSTNQIMTSSDGIIWTLRFTPINQWIAITFGNGIFVAVSELGSGNQIMTSSDGIIWTLRSTPVGLQWKDITYGNGLFVVVGHAINNNNTPVMTSPDGIVWTAHVAPVNSLWNKVIFGNGIFVAVGISIPTLTTTDHVTMTSSDGINWTTHATPSTAVWTTGCFADGLFIVIGSSWNQASLTSFAMYSADGINWTTQSISSDWCDFGSIAYGNGILVAVGFFGNSPVRTTSLVFQGTATLTFTGSALHHADSNDVNNLTVEWQNSAFTNPVNMASVNGSIDSTGVIDFIDSTFLLQIHCYIEGYFTPSNTMSSVLQNQGIVGATSTMCDSIEVQLYDTLNFNLITQQKVLLNTNGEVSLNLTGIPTGSYYVAIKHRNAIETWSALPIVISTVTTTFDFTTAQNKAYGANQIEVSPGIWALYSGDVTQDENVDLLDMSLLEADISNFQFGYVPTDINGDGNVDLLDIPLLQKNTDSFVYSVHP